MEVTANGSGHAPTKQAGQAKPARQVDDTPSVVDAADRVVEAARGLVEDRLRLAGVELRQHGSRVARGAGLVGVAALLGFTAWWLLCAAALVLLRGAIHPAAALALVAAANLALAAGVARLGARRLRDERGRP